MDHGRLPAARNYMLAAVTADHRLVARTMYITYETRQYRVEDGATEYCSGPYESPITRPTRHQPCAGPLEPPQFKPAWLVRTKDMKTVRGSGVHEAYYALSYSWNQSGEIFKSSDSEKYTRIDNGKHAIVSFKRAKIRKTSRYKPSIQPETRFVKFEGLIQRICYDFNIRYLWYDQMCIDQNNPDEKRREIRRMHKIYSHAQCTVVLVPELRANNLRLSDGSNYTDIRKIATSEWSKRAWTLEEALMSRRMLFIGQDVHLWSYILDRNKLGQGIGHSDIGQRFLYAICTTTTKYMASTVLWHARRRTSSKQHDRVFALANLFPETIKDLIFDYKQPLFDAMLSFYSLLAQKDPSILCFGVPFHHQYDEDHYFARKDENLLPSWSGAGAAYLYRSNKQPISADFWNYMMPDITNSQYAYVLVLTLLCLNPSLTNNSTHLLQPKLVYLAHIGFLSLQKETQCGFLVQHLMQFTPALPYH
ncbi:hypothetical protein BJV82DRAFT_718415 [Fennellomyces sp. T-0311]|nr:hypothetical protein BJV82DRAFT_718415 [Fennellomyces sp. T-0311]